MKGLNERKLSVYTNKEMVWMNKYRNSLNGYFKKRKVQTRENSLYIYYTDKERWIRIEIV